MRTKKRIRINIYHVALGRESALNLTSIQRTQTLRILAFDARSPAFDIYDLRPVFFFFSAGTTQLKRRGQTRTLSCLYFVFSVLACQRCLSCMRSRSQYQTTYSESMYFVVQRSPRLPATGREDGAYLLLSGITAFLFQHDLKSK